MAQVVRKESLPSTPAPRYADPFSALRGEIDRAFEGFFGNGSFGALPRMSFGTPMGELSPQIDMKETDNSIVLSAELPGIDEKDVDVSLRDNVLTLKGEKKSEKTEDKEDYHMTERHYGSFQRAFRLPDSIDPDQVTAAFDKGVLTVNVPKREEAKKAERKIAIGQK